MQNFDFQNPTHIVFGEGRIAELANLVPSDSRVLILYGGGSIKSNGTFDEVKAALAAHTVFEFSGIEPNPTYETLMKAVALVKAENIDYLLAVGGGSVADGTKFVAAAVDYEGEPWDILETFGSKITSALPFGVVLTLPATGSEMNTFSVISRKETQSKLAFGSPLVFPEFSILDPVKTYSLPPRQVANGIVDTFVHVMEQYMTYPADGYIQDRFAESILQTLIELGPKALQDPTNYAVRSNLMWCSTLALNGLISAGVPQDWSTHSLGHELTALYGIDHAQTLAVILPSMLKVRTESKRAKLLQYAERIWGLKGGTEEARIEAAIENTRAFFESLSVKTRLSDYGVGADAADKVVDQLKRNGFTALGENKDVTLEVSRKVVELSA